MSFKWTYGHHVFVFFLSINVTCHTRRTSSEVSDGPVGLYGGGIQLFFS